MKEEAAVRKAQREAEEASLIAKLLAATTAGGKYKGTATYDRGGNEIIPVTFTEQNGLHVTVELRNPTAPGAIRHFAGEIGPADSEFPVSLSPTDRGKSSKLFSSSGVLRLRTSENGREGHAKMSDIVFPLQLQADDTQ